MPKLHATRVRIVGGGLTGLLAAFKAHELGARDIELHDRHEDLGGEAWPRQDHGIELRDTPLVFGAPGDPARDLLERHGLAFEDYEVRRGAVTPSADGDWTFCRDFPGPSFRSRDTALKPVAGESLADRLRAYPSDLSHALSRYCQRRLGVWLDQVHESAAEALGVRRVRLLDTDPVAVAQMKRADPAADALYGLPASAWGRLENLTAATPRDGSILFFLRARQALMRLGVKVVDTSLVPPHAALEGRAPDEIVVWAADPTPLFRPLGLQAPAAQPRMAVTYLFKARACAGAPSEVRSFAPDGAVSTLRFHESRGQTILAAECVAETPDRELRREIHRLMAGFSRTHFELGDAMATTVARRWDCPSMEAVRSLRALRTVLERTCAGAVVAPVWEASRLRDRYAALSASLTTALAPEEADARAA